MNNRKQIFVSVPEFDIIIIEDFDKRMKQRNAAKTLRRDYKLYHMIIRTSLEDIYDHHFQISR